jgi:hypothetical protein
LKIYIIFSLTRVLRKCQFTDPNERTLLTTKVTKEVYNLEQWFQNMTSTIAENKVFLLTFILELINNNNNLTFNKEQF